MCYFELMDAVTCRLLYKTTLTNRIYNQVIFEETIPMEDVKALIFLFLWTI